MLSSASCDPAAGTHSESAGAGNVPRMTAALNDLAARFGVAELPPFPATGAVFDLVDEAGFSVPMEGVRSVAQRRQFTEEQASACFELKGLSPSPVRRTKARRR